MEEGIDPFNILLTFTNKAAREMKRNRIADIVRLAKPKPLDGYVSGIFFFLKILRFEPRAVYPSISPFMPTQKCDTRYYQGNASGQGHLQIQAGLFAHIFPQE